MPRINDDSPADGWFQGLSFFVLQRVPLRNELLQKITSNGGRIVRHEEAADHIIADHVRKDCPPASISWTFIDACSRAKAMVNPADHQTRQGQNTTRMIGSVVPGKSTRTPFTAEDDRALLECVKRAIAEGRAIKGNEIYKQLERANPRHTHQAWRDRYIKKLADQLPAGRKPTPEANTLSAQRLAAEPTREMQTSSLAERPGDRPHEQSSKRRRAYEEQEQPPGSPGKGASQQLLEEGSAKHSHFEQDDADHEDVILQGYKEPGPDGANTQMQAHTEISTTNKLGMPSMESSSVQGERSAKRQKSAITAQESNVNLQSPLSGAPNAQRQIYRRSYPVLDRTGIQNDRQELKGTGYLQSTNARTNSYSKPNGDANAANSSFRLKLTAANLASQQAQHRFQSQRAMDLPEDDETKDQTEFANFLSAAISQGNRQDSNQSLPSQRVSSASNTALKQKRGPTASPGHSSAAEEEEGRRDSSVEEEVEDAQLERSSDVDLGLAQPEGGWELESSWEEAADGTSERKNDTGSVGIEFVPSDKTTRPDRYRARELEISSLSSTSSSGTGRYTAGTTNIWRGKEQFHQAVGTQDITDAETQQVDLGLVLPADSDGNDEIESTPPSPFHPGSLTKRPAPPRIAVQDEIVDDLPRWMDTMRERKYTDLAIIHALKACSARTDLAELVLLEERSGRALPQDVPGIWSQEEDLILESGDARGLMKLEKKHGWDECRARLRYLDKWREA